VKLLSAFSEQRESDGREKAKIKNKLQHHRWQKVIFRGHIDHFTRCKQHWSRSTSCFSFSPPKISMIKMGYNKQ